MLFQDESREKLDKQGLFGQISIIVYIIALLLFIVPISQSNVFKDLASFFTEEISSVNLNLLSYIQISLFFSVILWVINTVIIKMFMDAKAIKADVLYTEEYLFKLGPLPMYIYAILEELFARLLPLGLLANWLHADTTGTFILFVMGTVLWSLIYLTNYKSGHRKFRYLIPTLIKGVILGYVFIVYGFWMSLLVNIVFSVLVYSKHKREDFTQANLFTGFYWFLVLILAMLFASSQYVDFTFLFGVFSGEITAGTPLAMGLALLFLSAGGDVLSTGLMLDNLVDYSEVYRYSLGKKISFTLLLVLFSLAIMYFIVWVSSLIPDPAIRFLVIFIIVFLLRAPKSGSALAKTWLVGTIGTYLTVLTVTTLPLASVLLIYLAVSIFDIPALIIAGNNQSN